MTLYEFMMKRLGDLGLKKADLVNRYDLEWSTLSKIKSGHSIQQNTQQKLALALQCTQGDIQACLAEVPNPLREEAERPEGTAGISIMAKPKKKVKPEAPAPDPKDEEPAEVFQTDGPEPEVDMMFPTEETEEEMEDRVTREVAEECYKRKLKDKVGRILAGTKHELTDHVRQEIGAMLLNELWGSEEN